MTSRRHRVLQTALLALLVLAFFSLSTRPESQADHEHLVALTKNEPAIQPLILSSRALVVLQLEPRFTQNMQHSMPNAVVRVQLQVSRSGAASHDASAWVKVGQPWELRIATDFAQFVSLQRHHPGKGLEDLNWRRHVFDDLGASEVTGAARLLLTTTLPKPISLLLRVQEMPPLGRHRTLVASLILVAVFGMIATEAVHRTVAAGVGSFLVIGTLAYLGERVTIHQVASWLDVDTLVLLFGMMALVGYLARTGVFEYIAARIFARVGRSPGRLVGTLCVAASVLSAFLDNVTVVLLITPITISLCKSMGLPAERVVLAMVFSSNIGGAATLVGDPPNLMIASQLGTRGITFGKFSLHVAPCVVLCMWGTLVYLKGVFSAELAPEARKRRLLEQHHHVQALLEDVEDGECAPSGAASTAVTPSTPSIPKLQPPRGSGGGMLVDDGPALSIAAIMSSGSSARAAFEAQAVALQRRYPIRDRALLRSTAPVFACVVLGLCLCSPLLQIELAWIPIVGVGAVSLLDSSEGGLEAVLAHIEWSTLLFFGALAILMRGITTLGLIQFLGNGLAHLIAHVPPTLQLPAALLIVLWGSATLSACIDNVPFTAAMIPIVQRLVETNGLPLQPLVTVLALGTCLGGNGSLIAASANIVAAGILEGLGMPINFKDFARLGVPVAFITISISSVYVIVLYVLIGVR